MLELDIVLQRFITQHFNHLTLSELQAFDEMLELPDNDFWGLVSNEFIDYKNAARQSIVEKLHAL
jgi:antitoxin CptB